MRETIDHSCKIFFWYLPNWTSTDLWCVVLYVTGTKNMLTNIWMVLSNLDWRLCISLRKCQKRAKKSTLSDVFALFFESFFTFDDIIFDLVLMESSFTLRFINGFTFFFTLALANQRGVAELDCFFLGLLLVFNETRFGEGLLAFFFLLGLKIGGVSSVALFTVSRMYAFNSNCFRFDTSPKIGS